MLFKILICFVLILNCNWVGYSQDFNISMEEKIVDLTNNSSQSLDISFTNKSDTTFVVSFNVSLLGNPSPGDGFIGAKGKISSYGKFICEPAIQIIKTDVSSPTIEIKPGETKNFKLWFDRLCFSIKGRYKLRLFIKMNKIENGQTSIKTYWSNKIDFKVI